MRRRRLWWLIAPAASALMLWWLLATASGLAWVWARAAAWLPGTLAATEVSGTLAGPLHLVGLRYTTAQLDFTAQTLDLDWEPWALLRGELHVAQLTLERGALTVRLAAGGTAAARYWPLAVRIDHGVVSGFTVATPGRPPLLLDSVTLSGRIAAGPGRRSSLQLEWTLTYGGHTFVGAGTLTGTFAVPTLSARLSAPFAASARGSVAWRAAPLQWHAEAALPPLVLNRVAAAWPAVTVGGRFRAEGRGAAVTVDGDGRVAERGTGAWNYRGRLRYGVDGWQLPTLELRPEGGTGTVELAGAWAGGERGGRVTAQWRNLAVPALAGWPVSGKLEAAGTPAAYRGSVRLAAAGRAPLQAQAVFAGNGEGVTVSTLTGGWLDGQWRGSGALQWRGGLRWQGALQTEGVNPGRLAARWSGRLAGKVTAQGRGAAVQVDSASVGGELAQRPFAANAAGAYADGRITLRRLVARAGQAQLTVSGSVGREWALKAAFDAPRLEDLMPGAAGAVALSGRLDGALRRPRLRLDGSARKVVLQPLRLGAARLHADIDLAGRTPWVLDMAVENAVAMSLHLHSARLRLAGSEARHRLTLDGVFEGGARLVLAAHGGWNGNRWRGELGGGSFTRPGQPAWTAPAAPLEVGDNGVALQRWCWRGGGHLCAAFHGAQGRWESDFDLAGVPLSVLQPWLARPDLTLGGTLSATATAAGTSAAVTRLALHGQVADGALTYASPDGVMKTPLRSVEFEAGSDGGGLRASLNLALAQGGSATARLALPGWLPGLPLAATAPVRGDLRLDTDQLDWLGYFVPALLRPSGTLHAQLDLGGSVGTPALSGRLTLRGGAVRLPAAGIALRDVTLDGLSTHGRQLTLSGSARSGAGRLQLSGRLFAERLGRWRVEAAVKGENFELMHLIQARVRVSPDLQLALEDGLVDVRGTLSVPQADIDLPQLPNSVTVSPDTVIVDAPAAAGGARRWRMHLDLRLAAGARVRLQGYGFSGRLTGAVRVQGDTPGTTLAQGELHVEDGRYQAYGQNLTIQRGRLLFVDSPPDNPGLDVRAIRRLPDQTGLVGVEVSGRLKQPRLRIFSDPVMDPSDALSWLVLGRPLAGASRSEADALYHAAFAVGGTTAARGVALRFGLDEVSVESGTATNQLTGTTTSQSAVVLGKYLSPRLYLQYAVGLWNSANQVRIRYQMSPHWTLRMEQGEPSGADFLYSIEH